MTKKIVYALKDGDGLKPNAVDENGVAYKLQYDCQDQLVPVFTSDTKLIPPPFFNRPSLHHFAADN